MSRYNNKVYLLLLPLSPLNNARESQDFPSSKSLLFHPSRYLIGRLHIVEGSRLYFSKTKLKKNYHFFHLFSFHTIRNFIEHAGLQPILFQRERFLLDMKAFINSSFTKNILLYWAINIKIVECLFIVGASCFPFGRRNYLNYY